MLTNALASRHEVTNENVHGADGRCGSVRPDAGAAITSVFIDCDLSQYKAATGLTAATGG